MNTKLYTSIYSITFSRISIFCHKGQFPERLATRDLIFHSQVSLIILADFLYSPLLKENKIVPFEIVIVYMYLSFKCWR